MPVSTAKPRIFLTHPASARANYYGARALAALADAGEVVVNPSERALTTGELITAARGCQIIVADRQTSGAAALFAGLPDLIAMVRVAVDIRNIDVEAASAAGVLVTRASPGFAAAVAEWIVGAMIVTARHTLDYATAYRQGELPTAVLGTQLAGATVGIIGFGMIGAYLGRLAHALGMRVLVHDPYKRISNDELRQVDLSVLLADSDFVVPLAVATPETENLIDAEALAKMKRTAWLINASRGDLIEEAALEQALDQRRIAGAVIDVGRAPDQMPSPRLARRHDVIATPHIGGLTLPAIEHQAMETTRQVAAIARGEVPPGAVNADQATRLARLASAAREPARKA